jgi:hypothetical protein
MFRPEDFAEPTTPSAPLLNGTIFDGAATPPLHVANRSEKLGVNRIVPKSVGRLGGSLPDLLQLGLRNVIASNVTVKGAVFAHRAGITDFWFRPG